MKKATVTSKRKAGKSKTKKTTKPKENLGEKIEINSDELSDQPEQSIQALQPLETEDSDQTQIIQQVAESCETQPLVLPSESDGNKNEEVAAETGNNNLSVEEESFLEVLSFILDSEEYGIDVGIIKEIIRSTELTSIPRTPDYLKGIISLRGVIIPIFDIRERLISRNNLISTLSTTPVEELSAGDIYNNIIIVALDKGLIGIMVDSVKEVLEIDISSIEPPNQVIAESESSHLKGISRYKGRLIILLALERLLEEMQE